MKKIDSKELIARALALRENAKVVMAVIVFLFLLDAAVFLRGQAVSLGRTFSEAKKLRVSIKEAQNNFKFFEANKGKKAELENRLAELSKKVLKEEDLPSVLESISKFADISAVRIQQVRPVVSKNAAALEGPYAKQQISLTIISGFHSLGRFMALLENAPSFFDIRQLEIRSTEQEYNKQLVTILLEVVLKKA